jgi:hypothetical protein
MMPLLELGEDRFQLGFRRPPAQGDYLTVEVLLAPRRFTRGLVARVMGLRPGADGLWYAECQIIGSR